MGKAILQGLIESSEPSKRSFDRFVVSVASSKSAQDLEAKFAEYGDHIEILHGKKHHGGTQCRCGIVGLSTKSIAEDAGR